MPPTQDGRHATDLCLSQSGLHPGVQRRRRAGRLQFGLPALRHEIRVSAPDDSQAPRPRPQGRPAAAARFTGSGGRGAEAAKPGARRSGPRVRQVARRARRPAPVPLARPVAATTRVAPPPLPPEAGRRAALPPPAAAPAVPMAVPLAPAPPPPRRRWPSRLAVRRAAPRRARRRRGLPGWLTAALIVVPVAAAAWPASSSGPSTWATAFGTRPRRGLPPATSRPRGSSNGATSASTRPARPGNRTRPCKCRCTSIWPIGARSRAAPWRWPSKITRRACRETPS